MSKPEVKIENDNGRVFVSVGGLIIDICPDDEGVTVQITRGNDVVGETGAEYVA